MNLDFCLTFNSVSKIPFGREMVKRGGKKIERIRDIVFFPYDPKKPKPCYFKQRKAQCVRNSLRIAEAGIVYLSFPRLTQLLLLKHFCNKSEERGKGPNRCMTPSSVDGSRRWLRALSCPGWPWGLASSCFQLPAKVPSPPLTTVCKPPSPAPVTFTRGICLWRLFSILLRFLLIGLEKVVFADSWG